MDFLRMKHFFRRIGIGIRLMRYSCCGSRRSCCCGCGGCDGCCCRSCCCRCGEGGGVGGVLLAAWSSSPISEYASPQRASSSSSQCTGCWRGVATFWTGVLLEVLLGVVASEMGEYASCCKERISSGVGYSDMCGKCGSKGVASGFHHVKRVASGFNSHVVLGWAMLSSV